MCVSTTKVSCVKKNFDFINKEQSILFSFCSDVDLEEDEQEEIFKPVGISYKDDVTRPVFSWSQKSYGCKGLAKLLLQDYEAEALCISHRVNVAHNVTFLVHNRLRLD